MENNKMTITVADFSFAINKAYERGFSKGMLGHVAQLPFDEIMRQNPKLWAEYDRRVGKVLETARAKWEASLDIHAKLDPIPGDVEEQGNE